MILRLALITLSGDAVTGMKSLEIVARHIRRPCSFDMMTMRKRRLASAPAASSWRGDAGARFRMAWRAARGANRHREAHYRRCFEKRAELYFTFAFSPEIAPRRQIICFSPRELSGFDADITSPPSPLLTPDVFAEILFHHGAYHRRHAFMLKVWPRYVTSINDSLSLTMTSEARRNR